MITHLPFAPLLAYVCLWHDKEIPDIDNLRPRLSAEHNDKASAGDLYRWLGNSHRELRQWHREGLTKRQAEKVCDHLRIHPTEVWGHAYFEATVTIAGLDEQQCVEIADLNDLGLMKKEIAALYNVEPHTIGYICRRFGIDEEATV